MKAEGGNGPSQADREFVAEPQQRGVTDAEVTVPVPVQNKYTYGLDQYHLPARRYWSQGGIANQDPRPREPRESDLLAKEATEELRWLGRGTLREFRFRLS